MFRVKVVEKIKTLILCWVTIFSKIVPVKNTSIYCQYVSWQLVSTIYSHHQANNKPY